MFTKEEAQFLYDNIANQQFPLSHPERGKMFAMADKVLTKLEEILKDADSDDRVEG